MSAQKTLNPYTKVIIYEDDPITTYHNRDYTSRFDYGYNNKLSAPPQCCSDCKKRKLDICDLSNSCYKIICECSYCDNVYSKTCITKSYINCIKCDKRTCYGVEIDTDITTCFYDCMDCNCIYSVCPQCIMKIDNTMSGVLMQIQSYEYDVVDVESLIDEYIPDYNNLIKNKVIEFDGLRNVDSCDYADGINIRFLNNEIYHDENIYGPLTGNEGGCGPQYVCQRCNFRFVLSDK